MFNQYSGCEDYIIIVNFCAFSINQFTFKMFSNDVNTKISALEFCWHTVLVF